MAGPRRHGLLGPTMVRIVALVMAIGLIAGLGAPYLLSAGVPLWTVVLLVLLVLAVPIVALARGERSRR